VLKNGNSGEMRLLLADFVCFFSVFWYTAMSPAEKNQLIFLFFPGVPRIVPGIQLRQEWFFRTGIYLRGLLWPLY